MHILKYLTIYGKYIDLQCCVNFSCTAKGFSYMYIYIFFHILSYYGLSQDIECSSLCYTVGLCRLFILYLQFVSANPTLSIHCLPPPFPLATTGLFVLYVSLFLS